MDQKEVGEWIDRQEYPLSAWLAWRAAMRVAPLAWKRPSMVEPKASNPHDDGTSGGILLALLFVEVGLGKPDVVDWVAQGMFAYTGSKIYAECFKFDDGLDEASFASFAASHLALGYFRTSLDCACKSVAGTIAESMFLEAMNSDVAAAKEGRSLDSRALWPNGNPLSAAWDDALDRWSRLRPGWDFWIRWYEGTLSGKRLPFEVQEQMALIAQEVWDQGATAVADEIARIEEELGSASPSERALHQTLSGYPSGSEADVERVRRAFVAHRAELPPTFDAILGLVLLEIERLQARNYRDADDMAEAKRQIGVLSVLYQSVEALQLIVPTTAEMNLADAQKAEKLSRVFVEKFTEWPRVHADDLVDSTFRFGLVGATTVMLPLIGVATPYAFAAGLVLFGGKKMADAVKVAKDAMKS